MGWVGGRMLSQWSATKRGGEKGRATYEGQTVLVALDERTVEALDGLDSGLRGLGDFDLHVGSDKVVGSL